MVWTPIEQTHSLANVKSSPRTTSLTSITKCYLKHIAGAPQSRQPLSQPDVLSVLTECLQQIDPFLLVASGAWSPLRNMSFTSSSVWLCGFHQRKRTKAFFASSGSIAAHRLARGPSRRSLTSEPQVDIGRTRGLHRPAVLSRLQRWLFPRITWSCFLFFFPAPKLPGPSCCSASTGRSIYLSQSCPLSSISQPPRRVFCFSSRSIFFKTLTVFIPHPPRRHPPSSSCHSHSFFWFCCCCCSGIWLGAPHDF